MSSTTKDNSTTTEAGTPITDAEEVKLLQAVLRTGRRNALGDLSEQIAKVSGLSAPSDVDKMAPHFQSMSIKN